MNNTVKSYMHIWNVVKRKNGKKNAVNTPPSQLSLSHTHTHSDTHTVTHTHTHTTNCHSSLSLTHTHSDTHTHTHTHTHHQLSQLSLSLTHTHSDTHAHTHTTIVAPGNPATYSAPNLHPPLPSIKPTLTITLVLLGGPVHALAIREGGDVGVGVDAQGQVAAPHAAVLRAAAAAAVLCARALAAHRLPLRLVGSHVAGCSHWKK